jgi:hypothetical protein
MPAAIKFDEWLGSQPAEVKAAYEEHTTGLRNAVLATRAERDADRKQVQELLKKAEKGSEAEKLLTEMQAKAEASERRAAFLESAMQPGIDCKNPRAALAIALAGDHFNRQGVPDWNAIKAEAPELFGKAIAPGNAGTGTGAPPPAKGSMNDFIRKAAGR